TGCCQPCRPYIEGRCARCELDRRLTGILAGPDDEIPAQLRPLHHAFVTAEHPKARLKWLSDSHGATVLATLVDSGQPLAHELLDQLPQTRELHYLRGLMVATGVLPDREEHLDRLPAWLEQRLEHAPPNHARLLTAATPQARSSVIPANDDDRWALVRRLFHDETIDLRARTAGCLVLIFGQPLSRLITWDADRIETTPAGLVTLRFDQHPVAIPEPLGQLLLRQRDTVRPKAF